MHEGKRPLPAWHPIRYGLERISDTAEVLFDAFQMLKGVPHTRIPFPAINRVFNSLQHSDGAVFVGGIFQYTLQKPLERLTVLDDVEIRYVVRHDCSFMKDVIDQTLLSFFLSTRRPVGPRHCLIL